MIASSSAIYTLSLHDALPIFGRVLRPGGVLGLVWNRRDDTVPWVRHLSGLLSADDQFDEGRSEEHTSELQSRPHLVCRLLLEKTTMMIAFLYSGGNIAPVENR